MTIKQITLKELDKLVQKRLNENNKKLENKFATKTDLNKFATKKDLERFATKEDLKNFATKKDLERFSTKEDMAENNQQMIDAVENHLSRYPTREEFFNSQDKLIKEIRDLREEVTVHNHQVQENRVRIVKLEETVYKN